MRSVPVRAVIDWVCRTGGFGRERGFAGLDRALEGARIHRRLQKERGEGYESEVPVSVRLEREGYVLEVGGRLDGLRRSEAEWEIEEIKTVRHLPLEPDPLHLAQARLYAGMLVGIPDRIRIVLTYFEVETESLRQFREETDATAVRRFAGETLEAYAWWEDARVRWWAERNASLRALGFPHADFRTGQRRLAGGVYRTVRDGARLLAEAPTGSGKTIAVLFGALKAIGEGHGDRILFLTAKTIGRTVAIQALNQLQQGGARLRWVEITAKDATCFCKTTNPCEVSECSWAGCYYDRRGPALRGWVESGSGGWGVKERGVESGACPFELSLDAALFTDVIVCDYNYFFDPDVGLQRFLEDPAMAAGTVVLVDEAHNLPDRAREMFSAELDPAMLSQLRKALGGSKGARGGAPRELHSDLLGLPGATAPEESGRGAADPEAEAALSSGSGEGSAVARACGGLLRAVRATVREIEASGEGRAPDKDVRGGAVEGRGTGPASRWSGRGEGCPEALGKAVERFLKAGAQWLEKNRPAPFREALLEAWFEMLRFQRTVERLGETAALLVGPAGVRAHCTDPGPHLDGVLRKVRAAVFFSGTLSPFPHFAAEFGSPARELRLDSPFPPEHLRLLVADRIGTALRARAASLDAVADLVGCFVRDRPGNHLVYLPSHAYLRALADRFAERHPEVETLAQEARMDPDARDRFLADLGETGTGRVRVVFAILGGVFGEAIDLAAGALAGVVVVGPGLPQIGIERELLREKFGFERAYQIPGMIRVIQAVGRLIRGPEDRGCALLIDERFSKPALRRLFPAWWEPRPVRGPEDLAHELRWEAGG